MPPNARAVAWQLPVVASDIPGNQSVVRQDETGFLYELNNSNDLVSTVLFVANNMELSEGVARRSRVMVEQQYSAEVCEHAHEILYMNISG